MAKTCQAVVGEQCFRRWEVVGFGQRQVRIEMIATETDLEAVVAPVGGQPAHLGERQIGPLAGEQGDRTGHQATFPVMGSTGVDAE